MESCLLKQTNKQLNSIGTIIYLITPILMKIKDVFNLVFLSVVNIIAINTLG